MVWSIGSSVGCFPDVRKGLLSRQDVPGARKPMWCCVGSLIAVAFPSAELTGFAQ